MFSSLNSDASEKFRREYQKCLTERFLQGGISPLFSSGTGFTHIVYDSNNVRVLCGRQVGGFSTHRSGLNVVCAVCKRRYFNALSSFLVGKYSGERILTPGADVEFEALSIHRGVFASPRKLARVFL